jgi:hypothetical protein
MKTKTLYRPIGQKEYELIAQSGFRAFPPRLPEQPIFYPVLSEAYAVQIAQGWNAKDKSSGFAGYVTRFSVRTDFLSAYVVQTVGASGSHDEYWIPAEDLEKFNAAIVGEIETIKEFKQ